MNTLTQLGYEQKEKLKDYKSGFEQVFWALYELKLY